MTGEPRRGNVELKEDGSFTDTPKKNKVGEDQFAFVAADPQGSQSEETQVQIKIMKPLDSSFYRDVETGQFAAVWLRERGLYSGFQVAGESCFGPEEPVTRGQFLAMVMELFQITVDSDQTDSGFADEEQAQSWLRPYLSAVMRMGIVSGFRENGQAVCRPNDPVTGADATVMLEIYFRCRRTEL